MSIASNLQQILDRIRQAEERSGRQPGSARLLAVSKTFPAEDVAACFQAGQRLFGENRVQEALTKIPALPDELEWHLIGPLQRNKVRKALQSFAIIHTVDSLRLAAYIDSVAAELGLIANVLLEVHIGGEESKFGFSPTQLKEDFAQLLSLKNMKIQGLMCIPPPVDSPEDARPFFHELNTLRNELQTLHEHPLPELSMGMSHDFEIAVEEGSTIVRVGSAIFGTR